MSDYDKGKTVDQLINKRDHAQIDLAKSQADLIDMGVKTIEGNDIHHQPGLDVEQFFDWDEQEFAWEAEYKDGTTIKQYGKDKHHYGNIDQDRLKKFRWVSCFDWQTDSDEKRVIVELDFEDYDMNFINGFADTEARNKTVDMEQWKKKDVVDKTLTMKMIRRESTTNEFPSGEVQKVSLYNRYLIGMKIETADGEKDEVVFCIEPNGDIHLWN